MAGQNILRFYAPKQELKLDISQTFDYKEGQTVLFDVRLDNSETFDFILDTSQVFDLVLDNSETYDFYLDGDMAMNEISYVEIINQDIIPYQYCILKEDAFSILTQNGEYIEYQN